MRLRTGGTAKNAAENGIDFSGASGPAVFPGAGGFDGIAGGGIVSRDRDGTGRATEWQPEPDIRDSGRRRKPGRADLGIGDVRGVPQDGQRGSDRGQQPDPVGWMGKGYYGGGTAGGQV